VGKHKPATIARRKRIEQFLAAAGHASAVWLDEERGFSSPGFWVISTDDGITTVSYKVPRKATEKIKQAGQRILEGCLVTLNSAPRYRAVLHANGCTILGRHIEVVEI